MFRLNAEVKYLGIFIVASHIYLTYPDNKGFSWHVKNEEKRKTSEEIMSKSC